MPELWPFQPEVGMTENLEWMTDVLSGRTGEQRIALRSAPRQKLRLKHYLEAVDAAWARAYARRNGAVPVGVPSWVDSVDYEGTVPSGATTISGIDTTIMDLRVGGGIVVWQDERHYTERTVTALTSSSVALSGTMDATYQNPVIAAVKTALLTDGVKFSRSQVIADTEAEFQIVDNTDLNPVVSHFPSYNGVDVMTDRPVLIGDVANNIIRAAEYVDNGFGPVAVETIRNYADFGQMLSFHKRRGAPLFALKKWFHSLRGKQGVFWMPTFSHELVPTTDIAAAASTFVVQTVGPPSFYTDKHIMVRLRDGTQIFAQISGATVVDSWHDALTLSGPLGVDVPLSELVMICFMSLSRLNSDSVEFTYEMDTVSVAVATLEVPA